MFQSLSAAVRTLRRSSGQDGACSVADDLDLVAMVNEARSDAERGYAARIASMRRARR
jgi:hypothetical protein